VITLEVTPEEGEKLALAATEGKLQLALRNFADNSSAETRGTTIPALFSRAAAPEKPAKQPATRKSAPAPSYTVETIRGSKVTETNFK